MKKVLVFRSMSHSIQHGNGGLKALKAECTLRKLSRAVEQSADLVVITDRFGVIEYVNPAFEKLTGYASAEATGQNPRILKSGYQSEEFYRNLWRTLQEGNVFRGVLANRKKNGEIYFAEKTISPIRNSSREITHFISTDRDITERRHLEAQLQQAQKMDAIGNLASGVAHDFNNLLMVISAYAELMLESLPQEDPLRHNVSEIIAAGRRAAELVRKLLAFGRPQKDALPVFDLNKVIDELRSMLPRLIGEDIDLKIIAGKSLNKVRADQGQIEQIVMNLATNARDAMPLGGELVIKTTNFRLDENFVQRYPLMPLGDYVRLCVIDSGEGIAPEHLPHIFEPFYTTKPEGKGTGLGLATVYKIVKQNNGFIWVNSELHAGTTFEIYLPSDASRNIPDISDSILETCHDGSETLLLVEDEDSVRYPAREYLTAHGYFVLEARNGEEALETARQFSGRIHLLITDVVMPQMGGVQLVGALRPERPDMKVLFVSGHSEATLERQGVGGEQAAFLQKPFGPKTLSAKIRETLGARVSAATAGSGR